LTTNDYYQGFQDALDEGISTWEKDDERIRSSRGQKEDWWRENGPVMVENYYKWLRATGWEIWTSMDGNPGIEYHLTTLLNAADEESRIKSYIDRVYQTQNGNYVIADIKTGARKPQSNLQLGMYRAGLRTQEGIDADLGCYLMVRKDISEAPSGSYMVDLHDYTPAFIERFVQNLRRGIKNEVFVPNTNSYCNTCGVARFCWAQNPTAKEGKKVSE